MGIASCDQYKDGDLEVLPPIISAEQAARVLGCSPRTIMRACEAGTLKACRAGNRWRVNRDSLFKYAGLEVTR